MANQKSPSHGSVAAVIGAGAIPTLIASVAALVGPCRTVQADSSIDPYYAGGAMGQSSEEIHNSEGISAAYLHAHPVGGKLLFGARPKSYVGGELEVIDFGRGHFGPSGDIHSASSHDMALAAFIVGYLPLDERTFDLFAKIGGAVYRSNFAFTGDLSNECIVANGVCIPLTQFPTSGSTTSTGFAFGVGMQVHLGHYAIRAEYERIARSSETVHEPVNTLDATGLGLGSLGITYGF